MGRSDVKTDLGLRDETRPIRPMAIPADIPMGLSDKPLTQKLTVVPFAYFHEAIPARTVSSQHNWRGVYSENQLFVPLTLTDGVRPTWIIPEGLPRNAFFSLRVQVCEEATSGSGMAAIVLRKDKKPAHFGYPSNRAEHQPLLQGLLYVVTCRWWQKGETGAVKEKFFLDTVRPRWDWDRRTVWLQWKQLWKGSIKELAEQRFLEAAQYASQRAAQRRQFGRIHRPG